KNEPARAHRSGFGKCLSRRPTAQPPNGDLIAASTLFRCAVAAFFSALPRSLFFTRSSSALTWSTAFLLASFVAFAAALSTAFCCLSSLMLHTPRGLPGTAGSGFDRD